MEEAENTANGAVYTLAQISPVRERATGTVSASSGWQGRLDEMGEDALSELRARAVGYARREVRRYWYWDDEENEPALPGGYSVEGVAHKALELLLESGAAGLEKVHGAEDIARELERLIKHVVWRLYARKENRLMVSEWDVLPPGPNGEPVSVFSQLPGQIPSPDAELMGKQKEELLGQFHVGFKASLQGRMQSVFQGLWEGAKRREMARKLGLAPERVKHMTAQLARRLVKFSDRVRDGMAEMLDRMGRKR